MYLCVFVCVCVCVRAVILREFTGSPSRDIFNLCNQYEWVRVYVVCVYMCVRVCVCVCVCVVLMNGLALNVLNHSVD